MNDLFLPRKSLLVIAKARKGPMAIKEVSTVREDETGKSYIVSQHDRIDRESGSLYYIWKCTCSARKSCRHIDKVVEGRWADAQADADYDGMDLMEREELYTPASS